MVLSVRQLPLPRAYPPISSGWMDGEKRPFLGPRICPLVGVLCSISCIHMCPWLRCQPSGSSWYLSPLAVTVLESRHNSISPPALAHEDPQHQPSGVPLSGAGGLAVTLLSLRRTACPPGDPTETVARRHSSAVCCDVSPSVDRPVSVGLLLLGFSCLCGSSLILNEGSLETPPPETPS